MADQSPQDPLSIQTGPNPANTNPVEAGRPSPIQAELPPRQLETSSIPPDGSLLEEARGALGWFLGLMVVLISGWGLMGLAYYLTSSVYPSRPELGAALASLFSLGLFLLLERNFWLSHLMGLRNWHGMPWWGSALLLWLFGIVGLLFRSTKASTGPDSRIIPALEPGRKSAADLNATDSFREIIETVVFVVVLVLLLKSFVAEAFVIPTGSMAQTLLGYQKLVECPDCGIVFPVNCSNEVDPSDSFQPPRRIDHCVCPNCRQAIQLIPPYNYREGAMGGDDLDPTGKGVAMAKDPGWNSGDRVLVAKFVYDLLARKPDRLDVVVFKWPGDSRFPTDSGPVKNHVPINYIKRLIGLPGETIAINRGKLFYLPPEKSPQYKDFEEAKNDPGRLTQLWRRQYMHVNDEAALNLFLDDRKEFKGEYQIVRKSPETVLAMMRLVYDNDHPARPGKGGPLPARWVSREGWKEQGPHAFRSEPEAGETRWLRYRHVLRGNGEKPQLITDFMGYNTWGSGNGGAESSGINWASDLILECEAQVEKAEGELTLEVSRGADCYQARFDLVSGLCSLYRISENKEEKLASADARVQGKGTYRLRLANVDDRLLVWVDNRLPFGEQGVPYASPKKLKPTRKNDLERPASVGVKDARVSVRHLKVFRDTYYTTASGGRDLEGSPSSPDVLSFRPDDESTWDALETTPVATFYVQPNHFLCLGDNSPQSSDGRSWGLVPERLMLGKALLVYYPFSRAGRIR